MAGFLLSFRNNMTLVVFKGLNQKNYEKINLWFSFESCKFFSSFQVSASFPTKATPLEFDFNLIDGITYSN